MSDDFSLESCLQEMGAESAFYKDHLSVYKEIDSTNSELTRRLNQSITGFRQSDGNLTEEGYKYHKMIVASGSQTAGRGRLGRVFYSPDKTGIYYSLVYIPKYVITEPSLYTISCVVGVCRAIDELYGCKTEIKWVNDIYLKGKKICGILTEGYINPNIGKLESCIVGIGINMSVGDDIPSDISQKAGGIENITGKKGITRSKLLTRCIYHIMSILDNNENIIEEYKKRSMLTGKQVTVSPVIGNEASDFQATVIGIDNNGYLVIKKTDGSEEHLSFGEVTLHYN